MVHRNRAADCLRPPLADTLSPRCLQLKKGFGECKRGMVDMRKRFRGNMPVAYQAMQRADEKGEGYQLYAGKSAFAGATKVTDGNEEAPPDWRELENEKYRATTKEQEEEVKRKAGEGRKP
jgi:cytochrome c oxidase assembly factor 5